MAKKSSNKKPKDIGDYGDYSKKTMEKLNKLVPFAERRKITKGMSLKHGEMEVRQMAVSRDRMSRTSTPPRTGPGSGAGGHGARYNRLTGGGLMKHGR